MYCYYGGRKPTSLIERKVRVRRQLHLQSVIEFTIQLQLFYFGICYKFGLSIVRLFDRRQGPKPIN